MIGFQRQAGFTLVELLVTLTIAALFVAIAVPSYRTLWGRSLVASRSAALLADLKFARSEAITRGLPVSACPSANGAGCGDGWHHGWIVFVDLDDDGDRDANRGESVLRVHRASVGKISIRGNRNVAKRVSFDANGFAQGTVGTLALCDERSKGLTRITISFSGRIRQQPPQTGATCTP